MQRRASQDIALTAADKLIDKLDQLLKRATLGKPESVQAAPNPGDLYDSTPLNDQEKRQVQGLMRINHTGEVCAQALYKGQALTAKSEASRELLLHAAKEELNHLSWCADRLTQLDTHPSHLNPLFFALSYTLGAVTGLMGDKTSLGFVAETEKQVSEHLEDHLNRIPYKDKQSRAIIQQMKADEERHGANAIESGGAPLPTPVKIAMRGMARVMKAATYRF